MTKTWSPRCLLRQRPHLSYRKQLWYRLVTGSHGGPIHHFRGRDLDDQTARSKKLLGGASGSSRLAICNENHSPVTKSVSPETGHTKSAKWPAHLVRALGLVFAAGLLLTACAGTQVPSTRLPKLSTPPSPVLKQAATSTTPNTSTTTKQSSPSSPPSTRWPPLVRAAMADLRPVPSFPLEAPSSLPAAPNAPNSAQVHSTQTSYQVSLFDCPVALGVGNPGIGTGACGAMDSVYGSFGAKEDKTADAARAEVAAPPAPASPCRKVATTPLGSDTTATIYAAPGSPLACSVTWQKGSWTFLLEGAPTRSPDGSTSTGSPGGPQPASGIPWGPIADHVLAQLSLTPLPNTPGLVVVDLAPDGIHTNLRWAVGRVLYSTGVYHGAVPAIALAASMSQQAG